MSVALKRKRSLLHLAVALSVAAGGSLLGASPALAAPDLIVNGSFERPNVPRGGFGIFSSIPGWTADPGTFIEIQDNVAGAPAPGAGDQFAELDSGASTSIYQDVPTTAGRQYTLTFIWSPRPRTAAADNNFEVSAGGTPIGVVGPAAGVAVTAWTPVSLTFTATSSTTRIRFTDLGPSNGLGAYLDLVTLRVIDCPTVVPPGYNVIRGTASADFIVGTAGNDFIIGGAGNDDIAGLGGDDIIVGNEGDDRISGGAGNDALYGCEGSDQLAGGAGNDTLSGGPGDDDLAGGDGDDNLYGDDGVDDLAGNAGTNVLVGGPETNDRCVPSDPPGAPPVDC